MSNLLEVQRYARTAGGSGVLCCVIGTGFRLTAEPIDKRAAEVLSQKNHEANQSAFLESGRKIQS